MEVEGKVGSESMGMAGVVDVLARMPERAILDEKAMAEAFRVTPRTVRRMVGRYEIPPGVPLAGKTVWMAGKVLSFLESKMEQAESSARGRAEAFLRNRT
jgi:N-methylhydantoinase B/oxoprolinase/acetone carboxylase alpha subunit